MPDRYDINKWKDRGIKNLFIWRYFMGGHELDGWRLKETRPWQNTKTEKVVQYYWVNNADTEEQVKIDIIECHSWQYAQQQLLALLRQHMHIQLPEAEKNIIRVGDAAYTGEGQEPQHLLFVRANMVVVLNSIGKKKVPVAKTALQLDNVFYDKPLLRENDINPVIERILIDKKDRKTNEQSDAEVIIDARDPLQGPLWYKLVTTRGEILTENDNLHLLFMEGEPNHLTVYATNGKGNTADKSIDL
jgi:hypothetical protein